ncbi:MAG: hypothetical protein FWD87_00125 [Spirochaetaceae bacterium]|nr:hypothetical protein [Spirochaetaceae bacterium]
MKKNILVLLVIFVLIISVFTGCKQDPEPDPVSIEGRINQFVGDLNTASGRSGISKHFHSSHPFSNIDADVLIPLFPTLPDGSSYSVGSISSGDSTRTVVINRTSLASIGRTFIMLAAGNNWYILNITVAP